MNLRLAGEVTVVAGAARGIGRAIAVEFAREGAPVAIYDQHEATIAVADEIQSETGGVARGFVVDVADDLAVTEAAAMVESQLGVVRHVIYAVGAGSGKYGFPFWNLAPTDWPRVLDVNLIGAVRIAHAFAPAMAERRRGSMLFISSVAGQIGSPTDPPYSAAKAGLLNFMQCAARDLAPHGVRANAICPGMVRTEMVESVWRAWSERQSEENRLSFEAWAAEKVARVAPLGRWQEAQEIAALAAFLASERARNITGQTFNVDGGQIMR